MQVHRYAVFVLVWAAALTAQTNTLTKYHDPVYGVSFTYPSEWKEDPKLGWYLGTDILHAFATEFEVPHALAKVGFHNTGKGTYAGTMLDGVEFVYFVVPDITKDACYARLTVFLENTMAGRQPSSAAIHGVRYLHFESGDGGLGHAAGRDIYAGYLEDRCYLFEAGIHSEPGSDRRILTKEQNNELRARLNAVMQSVQISPHQTD